MHNETMTRVLEVVIIQTLFIRYADTQVIYPFGSWGTENEWLNSDVDMAVLLPPVAR